MYRHISKGSWTFSDQDQGWQLSDCTAEGLKVTNDIGYKQRNLILSVHNHNKCKLIKVIFLVFQCCLHLSMLPPEIVGKKMEPEMLYDSVNILLSLQASTIQFIVKYF